jgi:uncharacterized membrane protein YkoI
MSRINPRGRLALALFSFAVSSGVGLSLGLAAAPALASPPPPLDGAALSPQAKVDLATARATALKARPGRITAQELEKEAGGSGLRYSFDIKSHGKVFEVGVDAVSGAVLENKAEGKNPD